MGDFLLIDDDNGAIHAITTATENPAIPGQYELAGTLFEASQLSLKPPSTLSVQAYETLNPSACYAAWIIQRSRKG